MSSVQFFNPNKYTSSLTQLLGGKPCELIQLIDVLTPLDSVADLPDLANKVKQRRPHPERLENLKHQVYNFFFKQFPNPIPDAIREIISNGLDAIARAHADGEIDITLNKNKISIEDKGGDGIGFDTLISFFVQARTSNPEAIFSIEKGLPDVTGRYGQGVLAIFYLLLYHTRQSSNPIPSFNKTKDGISLQVPFNQNGEPHEVLFSHSTGSKLFDFTITIAVRKISIYTCRKGQQLKIKLFEKDGKIYVDILTKKEPPTLQGSRFNITSPLIGSERDSILKSTQNTFCHVLSPPIYLNGQKINHRKVGQTILPPVSPSIQDTESLKEIPFEWGSVSFSPPSPNRQSSIIMCERGKQICEYSQTNSHAPSKVVLNFNRLNLTHDRATFDFKDLKCIQCMEQLINEILQSPQLSPREKSRLLNALYVILKEDRFNFIKRLSTYLEKSSYRLLPDLPGFETVDDTNTLFLNPRYITTTKAPTFYQSGNTFYYWIDNLSMPYVACVNGMHKHFFLDSRLNSPSSKEITLTNLSLFNQILELQDAPGQIPLEHIFDTVNKKNPSFQKDAKTDETPSSITLIDMKKCGISETIEYEDDIKSRPPSDFHLLANEFSQIIYNSLASVYPNEVVAQTFPCIKELILYIGLLTGLQKRNLLFIIHVLSQHPELRFYVEEKQYNVIHDFSLLKELREIEEALFRTKAFLNAYPEEEASYKQYIFQGSHIEYHEFPKLKSLDIFDRIYWRYKNLFKTIHFPDFFKFCIQKGILYDVTLITDEHISLLSKIQSQQLKRDLLPYLFTLKDVSFLLDQPLIILHEMVNICNAVNHSRMFLSVSYDTSFYERIQIVLNRFEIVDDHNVKFKCALLFFEIYLISYIFTPLKINFDCLLDYFIDYINENGNEEELSNIIPDIHNGLVKIKDTIQLISYCLDIDVNKLSREKLKPAKANLLFYQKYITTQYRHFPEDREKFLSLLEPAFEWYESRTSSNSQVALRDAYLGILDKLGLILPEARGFLNAALNFGSSEFASKDFTPPKITEDPIPLHQDPDVLIEGEANAAFKIQSAIKQNVQRGSWNGELIKNPIEAGAKNIHINLYSSTDLFVEISDDAGGMGEKAIQAFKTPFHSTKLKEETNPNFGWGVYTVYSEFDAVYVKTSEDGWKHTYIHFEKHHGYLTRRQTTRYEKGSIGTTIILQKSNQYAEQDFIRIKTGFANFCKHINDVKIYFQGTLISNFPLKSAIVKHTELLIENGINKGPIKFHIADSEGLFYKEMRLGPVPVAAYALLPDSVKKAFAQESTNMSIFLPSVQQNMNRNHIINQNHLMRILQRGILAASLQFYLTRGIKLGHFKELSTDFWNDFRIDYDLPSTDLQRLISALKTQKWPLAINPSILQDERQLVDKLRLFFNMHKARTTTLDFPGPNRNYTLEQTLQAILSNALNKHLDNLNDTIKTMLSDPRTFAELLMHLPLKEGEPSLAHIRKTLKHNLIEFDLLTTDGNYTNKAASLTPEEALEQISFCCDDTFDKLDLSEHFDHLLNKFKNAILKHLEGVKAQEAIQSMPEIASLGRLAQFIKTTAREILNHDIEIIYYEAADSRRAYTKRGSNKIWLNKKDQTLIFLSHWLEDKTQKFLDIHLIKRLVDLLTILCHEITHQKENQDCDTTHDETFKMLQSRFLEKLFIRPQDQIHCLQLFGNT